MIVDHDSISVRLTRIALAVAVILGVVVGVGQFANDVYTQRTKSRTSVQGVMATIYPLASEAAYRLDRQSAEDVITGLITNSTISTVKIQGDRGQVLAEKKHESEESPFSDLLRWVSSEKGHYTRELYHPNYDRSVGSISIRLNTDEIGKELINRAIFNMVLGVFRNLALVTVLLYFFRRIVTSPLIAIADDLEQVDSKKSKLKALEPPHGHQRDELAHIVEAINNLLRRERDASEQLRQSQKLEAVGHLTGGVAHDFNNLLAVILGNLELAQEDVDEDERAGLITNAIEATLRGADLTRNMLAFARKAPLDPKVLDLNEVVRNAKNWVSRAILENIQIETSLLAGLWLVKVDEASTASAILNLIVNARDAMPDGGRITIETANLRVDDDYVHERGEDIAPGRYVMVAISDTGTGMPPDVLAQIFEPFFTTKGPGAGSGLGLSMAMGFLKQSGGTVRVYSEPGVGSTFKLYFPTYLDGRTVGDPRAEASAPGVTAGARLLVVEDEPELLAGLELMLTRAGYKVDVAANGDAAAQIFAKDAAYDVVLTDIVMPGTLQGTTLATVLRAIRPDLPVVFMSGYAGEAAVHGNGLRHDDVRLMKPVRRTDLLAAVEKSMPPGRRG